MTNKYYKYFFKNICSFMNTFNDNVNHIKAQKILIDNGDDDDDSF